MLSDTKVRAAKGRVKSYKLTDTQSSVPARYAERRKAVALELLLSRQVILRRRPGDWRDMRYFCL